MENVCLIKKSTLTAMADSLRDTLGTTTVYTPEEMISAIGSNNIVNGSSLVNYNITFSFSSTSVTIVVVYSTWMDEGIKITTVDLNSTTTLQILQNSTFTIMSVDGTYELDSVSTTGSVNDIRSIATGVYYSYVFSCYGDGSVYFSY